MSSPRKPILLLAPLAGLLLLAGDRQAAADQFCGPGREVGAGARSWQCVPSRASSGGSYYGGGGGGADYGAALGAAAGVLGALGTMLDKGGSSGRSEQPQYAAPPPRYESSYSPGANAPDAGDEADAEMQKAMDLYNTPAPGQGCDSAFKWFQSAAQKFERSGDSRSAGVASSFAQRCIEEHQAKSRSRLPETQEMADDLVRRCGDRVGSEWQECVNARAGEFAEGQNVYDMAGKPKAKPATARSSKLRDKLAKQLAAQRRAATSPETSPPRSPAPQPASAEQANSPPPAEAKTACDPNDPLQNYLCSKNASGGLNNGDLGRRRADGSLVYDSLGQ